MLDRFPTTDPGRAVPSRATAEPLKRALTPLRRSRHTFENAAAISNADAMQLSVDCRLPLSDFCRPHETTTDDPNMPVGTGREMSHDGAAKQR